MCRKLVVTNEIFLGTRAICYEAYSLPKGEVVELTEKQIKDALKGITTDEVYGLELSEAGELVMDKKNFFTTNMMKKIHTNTLIPMVEEDCLANLFYIVIGTHKEKGNTMYDVISSRYERTSFTEEKVKTLLDMHIISAGAKLENGAVSNQSMFNFACFMFICCAFVWLCEKARSYIIRLIQYITKNI